MDKTSLDNTAAMHDVTLLRLLTKYLPDMLWIKDMEGRYIYANQALCDNLLIADCPDEVIGKDDLYFAQRQRNMHKDIPDWHTFGEICANSDHVVEDANQPMQFEEYGNVKGKLMYLEVFKAPFFDENGNMAGTVGVGRDITELKRSQESMQEWQDMAYKDSLTKLPNRLFLLNQIPRYITAAKRNNYKLAIAYLDLDGFKEINDTYGHQTGDQLLINISARMQKAIRGDDILARIGGDEFVVLLNSQSNQAETTRIVQRILETVSSPMMIDTVRISVSISIGVTYYSQANELTAKALISQADRAMYEAKKRGKNRIVFYDESMSDE